MELWSIVEDSRVSRRILPTLNATFLTLIPKYEGDDSPDKFKPISLCNVIYKIITKVIVNRLKPLLLGLISLKQLGFLEGQHIKDEIILVHEMIHSIKSKKIQGMMVKLDIAKAYDKINWKFIQSMLTSFGFSAEWIECVMSLVSSKFFSILVNGVPFGLIKSSRGIRRGDTLSPFIFILMVKCLGSSIAALRDNNDIRGLRVNPTPKKKLTNNLWMVQC